MPLLVGFFFLMFLITEPSQCRSLNQPFIASEWCKEVLSDVFWFPPPFALKKICGEGAVCYWQRCPVRRWRLNCNCQTSMIPALGRGVQMQFFSVAYSVYCGLFPQGLPGLQVLSLGFKHIGSNKNNHLWIFFFWRREPLERERT